MPDTLISFLPLRQQTADDVRARFDADANAGVDPTDEAWRDLTPGGFYWDTTQPCVLESVRLWTFLGTEVVAAMIPGTAWGEWLDLHAETLGLVRGGEVEATGTVLFSGTVGTLIPSGTQVSTVQADPSGTDEPVVFETTRSITLVDSPGPTNLVATPAGTGGTVPAGSYYYRVTAVGANGETIASNEVFVTLTGATSSVALTWSAVGGATAYKIYRGTAPDAETLLDSPAGTTTSYSDTGAHTAGTDRVPTNTVAVVAVEPGASGNVGTGTITEVLSPIEGSPGVTNTQPTSGGADVETDDRLRQKVLADYAAAAGGGTVADYVRQALSVPQVGYVLVQPLWSGAGTVRVIVTDQSNHPVSASIVEQLQQMYDPVAQQGQGAAPVGALVTVTTPSLVSVNYAAAITFKTGYSLDGDNGTVAQRDTIESAVNTYLNTRAPGEHVVLYKVIAAIMSAPGVDDASGVTLNGSAANVTITALQVATAGTPALT